MTDKTILFGKCYRTSFFYMITVERLLYAPKLGAGEALSTMEKWLVKLMELVEMAK